MSEPSEKELLHRILVHSFGTAKAARALAAYVLTFATFQVLGGFFIGWGVIEMLDDSYSAPLLLGLGGFVCLVGIVASLWAGFAELSRRDSLVETQVRGVRYPRPEATTDPTSPSNEESVVESAIRKGSKQDNDVYQRLYGIDPRSD